MRAHVAGQGEAVQCDTRQGGACSVKGSLHLGTDSPEHNHATHTIHPMTVGNLQCRVVENLCAGAWWVHHSSDARTGTTCTRVPRHRCRQPSPAHVDPRAGVVPAGDDDGIFPGARQAGASRRRPRRRRARRRRGRRGWGRAAAAGATKARGAMRGKLLLHMLLHHLRHTLGLAPALSMCTGRRRPESGGHRVTTTTPSTSK